MLKREDLYPLQHVMSMQENEVEYLKILFAAGVSSAAELDHAGRRAVLKHILEKHKREDQAP